MKCKKCKSTITSPIVNTSYVNGTSITLSSCPVCGENLDSSNKHWIIFFILFIALSLAAKYFS